jgi:branched-chain amino acid transport system substrate-binding protein
MKRLLILSIWAFSGLAAFGQDEIKLGAYGSLTGDNASFGTTEINGIRMAVDEINKQGGVLGKKVQLFVEDNETKQGETTTIVRKLIGQDHVIGIIGEVASSKALEAAPIAQESKIPLITTGATNPKITQIGDYIFRDHYTDDFQAVVIARFIQEQLKAKKVAFLTDLKQDYSVGVTKIAEAYLKKQGVDIVKEQSYSSGDKDFRAQLTDVKLSNPEVIAVTGYYPEAALICKQARQLGIKAIFVGGDGWDGDSLVPVGGKAVEGTYFADHFAAGNPDPGVQAFVKNYQQIYHVPPNAFAALGYDAVNLFFDAAKRVGSTDPAKVRNALAVTKNFPGVTGKITINAQRNATKASYIITVKGGVFQYYSTVEPQS